MNVIFDAASDRQCIDITIVDDDMVELTEEFGVVLAPNSPVVVLGTISSAVVSIADDDQGEDGIYTAVVSRAHPISCLRQRTCLL